MLVTFLERVIFFRDADFIADSKTWSINNFFANFPLPLLVNEVCNFLKLRFGAECYTVDAGIAWDNEWLQLVDVVVTPLVFQVFVKSIFQRPNFPYCKRGFRFTSCCANAYSIFITFPKRGFEFCTVIRPLFWSIFRKFLRSFEMTLFALATR